MASKARRPKLETSLNIMRALTIKVASDGTEETINKGRVSAGSAKGKIPLERPGCKWEDDIKIGHKE
jgi:hypothetical protein